MSPTDHETPADRKRDAERIQSEDERRLQERVAAIVLTLVQICTSVPECMAVPRPHRT